MTSNSDGQFAIRTEALQKVFENKIAVRNLSLTVNRGEIFGFLGPNGAGKSTSIKMLLGLVRPTGGDASVFGSPCGNVQIRKRIGFLPESFRFSDWMTPTELLWFHGRLCGPYCALGFPN
jgi:ABC-2 type transport system ATP-binding protein